LQLKEDSEEEDSGSDEDISKYDLLGDEESDEDKRFSIIIDRFVPIL